MCEAKQYQKYKLAINMHVRRSTSRESLLSTFSKIFIMPMKDFEQNKISI